ncbi:MAG: TniB family NTP-binding protein [Mycobacterium sp.]
MNDDDDEITTELKNITLTTKEGWAKFVNAPKRIRPKSLTLQEIKELSASDRRRYKKQRNDWHANLGVIETPPLLALHKQLAVLMDSNASDANLVKGGLAIEGPAGIGKTTAVENFAKKFHLDEIADGGPMTREGHERWPVCRITLNGTPTPRALYIAMLHFLAHPAVRTGNADQFKLRALDAFLDCSVRLLIIDEVHFSAFNTADGVKLSNTFKSIANDFPVTTLFVGIGLSEAGFFSEGRGDSSKQHNVRQQTARRVTAHAMGSFEAESLADRRQWRTLVRAIEKQLVLADHEQRSLASGEMSDYLYVRTQGYFQSLATLITRGCALAILNGQEALTIDLLEQVTIDVAAESGRESTHAKLRTVRQKQSGAARMPA